jgi:hypothetical protein
MLRIRPVGAFKQLEPRMNTTMLRWTSRLLALALSGAALTASAVTTMKVNYLVVYRDGSLANWLQDQNLLLDEGFDNGDPTIGPAFTGGAAAGYIPLGASANPQAISESGGQLLMNASLGDISANAVGTDGHSLRLRLLTNINDPNLGLPQSRSFGAGISMPLDTLPSTQSNFGMRLSDAFSNSNDVIELSVVNGAAGLGVLFRKQDFQNGTITNLGFAALAAPAGASNVVLALVHLQAGSNTIGAAYGYLDGNNELINGLTPFANVATAFNGEVHTRLELRATAPVPEPAGWLMMGIGLAATVAVMRRRGRVPPGLV